MLRHPGSLCLPSATAPAACGTSGSSGRCTAWRPRRRPSCWTGWAHARSRYFKALAERGLVPIEVVDLTAEAIPYWELRAQSPVRTGIEEAFLTGYREGSFHYLLIAADRA